MKRLLLMMFLAVLCSLLIAHISRPGANHSLYATGAPQEVTCGLCHGTGANVYLNVPPTYTPGSRLLVVLGIQGDSMANAGAQLTVVDTNGRTRGSLLPANYLNTPAVPIHYNGSRAYVEHDNPILPAWTNQAFLGMTYETDHTYNGKLIFYASGVSSNGDSTIFGDQAGSAVAVVTPPPPLSIPFQGGRRDTIRKEVPTSILYHDGQILIRGQPRRHPYNVMIGDAIGNTIFKGATHLPTVLNATLSPGIYWAQVSHEETPIETIKFLLQ